MEKELISKLFEESLLNEKQKNYLNAIYSKQIVSLFYELRTLLLGVLLFSTGVGILIYNNIDSIGHISIITLITLLMIGCYAHCYYKKQPYSNDVVKKENLLEDYSLLLGSLLFLSLGTYLQYQYEIFGDRLEAASLIAAIWFLLTAYFFDHRGVLALGVVGLASFFGLAVTPVRWYESNIFNYAELSTIGLIFGIAITVLAMFLDRKNIKNHFTFSYLNFSSLILFTSCLAAMFDQDLDLLYFILLGAFCYGGIYYAKKEQSFIFLLYSVIFGYVGFTYMCLDLINDALWLYYFVFSCIGLILFLLNYKKLLVRKGEHEEAN